jgi:hypothetical protein
VLARSDFFWAEVRFEAQHDEANAPAVRREEKAMRRFAILVAGALCILSLTTVNAHADTWGMSGFGGKIGYASPEDLDGTVQFGAHIEFESPGNRFHILPSVLYWSEDRFSDFNPNLDVYYHFNPEGFVTPYLGAGLGMHLVGDDITDDSETDVGANIFGGLRIPASSSHYFVEGRYSASDISQFSILGGITLHR